MIGIVSVKHMLDGGQHFLKMSMTVLPENYSNGLDDPEVDSEIMKMKNLYSAGSSYSKKAKLTSVNKCPCPHYLITLTDRRASHTDLACDKSDEDEEMAIEIQFPDVCVCDCLRLKSYRDLKKDHEKFIAFCGNEKLAKVKLAQ